MCTQPATYNAFQFGPNWSGEFYADFFLNNALCEN